MGADAPPPCTIALLGYGAHGLRYHHQHGRCCLRTSLGDFSGVCCLGYVVGRRCYQRSMHSMDAVPNVSKVLLVPYCRSDIVLG
jgi:hypothetical protein